MCIFMLYIARRSRKNSKISFGCTGGHHRSVMLAEEFRRRLAKAGYATKVNHRDIEK